MFNIVRHCISVARWFNRVVRYQDSPQWTQADAAVLTSFLNSPTGAKMDVLLTNRVLDSMQEAVTKRGDAYEVGTANGVRLMLVNIKMLSANGAAPQDSPTDL